MNLRSTRQQNLVAAALWLLVLPSCTTHDGDPGGTSTGGATEASTASPDASTGGSTGDPATGAAEPTTGAPDPTTGAPDPTTGAPEPTTEATTQEPDGTTEPAPTDGPGVLPGESGLDAFCRRFKECGGMYYENAQACIDASHDYWGDCPTRQAALDAFGECMSELDCGDWSPDAYNPNSTPCAEQWQQLGASRACA